MTVSDLQGLAIEHVKNKDPFVLKAREAFLIQKFETPFKAFPLGL